MNGVAYKDTFAGKGSALYEAITENRLADAKRIYAETSARYHATLHGLKVPRVVHDMDKGTWKIVSDDAAYDNNGRIKK